MYQKISTSEDLLIMNDLGAMFAGNVSLMFFQPHFFVSIVFYATHVISFYVRFNSCTREENNGIKVRASFPRKDTVLIYGNKNTNQLSQRKLHEKNSISNILKCKTEYLIDYETYQNQSVKRRLKDVNAKKPRQTGI